MDEEQKELYERMQKEVATLEEELRNLSYNEQVKRIASYQTRKESWERKANALGMFPLVEAIQKLPTPKAVDYENQAYIQRYIEAHPEETGINLLEAEEFFNPLCWKKHHSSFDFGKCLHGHLSELNEYYQQKNMEANERAESEREKNNREWMIKSFFRE